MGHAPSREDNSLYNRAVSQVSNPSLSLKLVSTLHLHTPALHSRVEDLFINIDITLHTTSEMRQPRSSSQAFFARKSVSVIMVQSDITTLVMVQRDVTLCW